MGIGVIILLIAGVAALVIGFVLPVGADEATSKRAVETAVKDAVKKSVEDSKSVIQQKIDDTIEESLLKTERGLDRITNEKMGAISEYADTVLGDIHKNHDEVMFMYDMLNDKHKNLANTVSEVSKTQKEARQTVLDAELTAKEAAKAVSKMGEAAQKFNAKSVGIAPPNSDSAAGYYDAATPPLSFHNDKASSFFENLANDPEFQNNVNAMRLNEKEKIKIKGSQGERIFDTIGTKAEFTPLGNTKQLSQKDIEEQFARVFGDSVEDNKDYSSQTEEMDAVRAVASATGDSMLGAMNAQSYVTDKVVPISGASKQNAADKKRDEQYRQEEQNRQNNAILDMHEQGKSNIAIARELGLGVGEVGLVIELAQKNRRKRAES